MASPENISIEDLLEPINDESPSGDDQRLNTSPLCTYQSIKTARSAARDAEKNSIYSQGENDADEYWRKIISLAPELLKKESKDLEVATWLTEAMVRRYGFSGLRDSLKLIDGLIERYWDGLFPEPDEDGIETRVAPLSGLNGTSSEGVLIAPLRKVVITEGFSPGPFAFYQYQQAIEAERTSNEDAKEAKFEKLGFNFSTIEQSVAESSVEFYINLIDDIQQSIGYCKSIESRLDPLCGVDAPSTRAIINSLQEIESAINHIAKHRLPIEQTLQNIDETGSGLSETASSTKAVHTTSTTVDNAVLTRELAFRKLLELADFFRKTEPHSPISYALEKAVKWGNMSLEQLIVELIPDSSSRRHFSELTGVKTDED